LVTRSGNPVVIDADGLNWLAKWPNWWEHLNRGQFVLTPHAGEMARLLDVDVSEVVANASRIAKDTAAEWGQTVVLKSLTTVVAGADGQWAEIEPPPALATAGSGDVLSGAIASFLAQGLSPFDAGKLAVYVGARAAVRVSARYGTLGVLASDLPAAIAEELGLLEGMER
jgi:NAD(P)H-hydrate epimerase